MRKSGKEQYELWAEASSGLPLYLRPWWLSAAYGEHGWNVVLSIEGDQIAAAWPFPVQKKWGQQTISPKPYCLYSGIHFQYPSGQKLTNRIAFEHQHLSQLIDQLPQIGFFSLKFDEHLSNWLPFFWKGFSQTTHYTYLLEDLSDLNSVFSNFRENIRREIRKAETLVTVEETTDLEDVWQLHLLSMNRNGVTTTANRETITRLERELVFRNLRKIWIARDAGRKPHAGLYLCFDENTAWYLFGGTDKVLAGSGAMSLLMWKAIQFAAEKGLRFNFEGSMIPGVERYFRAFGGRLTPCMVISHNRSFLFKAAGIIKQLLSKP